MSKSLLFAIDNKKQEVVISNSKQGTKKINLIEHINKKDNDILFNAVNTLTSIAKSPHFDIKVFEVMQADQFAEIILECPNVINELKCIALFTCNTSEFANILRTKFPKTYIIYWKTIVTDEASQLFAQGFTAQIAKQISDGYDSKTDIWSFGCILIRLCNFDTPFMAMGENRLI